MGLAALSPARPRPNVRSSTAPFGYPPTRSSVYGGGGFIEVVVLHAYTGYFTDPNEPFPKTGDIAYVRAVARTSALVITTSWVLIFSCPMARASLSARPIRCSATVGVLGQPPSETRGPTYGACLQAPRGGQLRRVVLRLFRFASRRVPRHPCAGGVQQETARDCAVRPAIGWLWPRRAPTVAPPVCDRSRVQPVTVFYEADFENLASSGVTAARPT